MVPVHRTKSDTDIVEVQRLVAKVRNGDNQAFQLLVTKYRERIYNLGLKFFNDRDLAMEAMSHTFLTVHQKIDHLKEDSKFQPWLYRIAYNTCISQKRKRQRTMGQVVPIEGTNYRDDQLQTADGSMHQKHMQTVLKKALERIPEEQKMVVIMKEYDGLKFREIAEVLNESENTVKSRLYYGLKALKKVLQQNNITQDIYNG